LANFLGGSRNIPIFDNEIGQFLSDDELHWLIFFVRLSQSVVTCYDDTKTNTA